jgi:hypothetical protein
MSEPVDDGELANAARVPTDRKVDNDAKVVNSFALSVPEDDGV